jgi:hypothetical protein
MTVRVSDVSFRGIRQPRLWGKGISVSRIVGAIFQFDRFLSSTNKLRLGYRMADVKKIPEGAGLGALLRY